MWAAELVGRKASFDGENLASSASATNDSITTLAADSDSVETDDQFSTLHCSLLDKPFVSELEKLPPNYVVIRDSVG